MLAKRKIILIITFLIINLSLNAKGGKGLDDLEESVEQENQNNKNGILKTFVPRVGIAYSPVIIMGDLSNYMSPGLTSVYVFGRFKIPVKEMGMNFLALMGLEFTVRAAVGFSQISSLENQEDTASINLLPFHAGMDFSYPLKTTLKRLVLISPYLGFDFGASMTSMDFKGASGSGKGNKQESSLDSIMGLSIGSTFKFKSLSVLEFYTDFRFLRFLEKKSNDFLFLSFGVGYII